MRFNPLNYPLRPDRRLSASIGGSLITALVLAFAGPASATEAFSYRWESPHVELVWREGNGGEEDREVRAMLGHWKRLAESVRRRHGQGRLRIEASFYGMQSGSASPRVTLRGPAGTVEFPAGPGGILSDGRFLAAVAHLAAGKKEAPAAGAAEEAETRALRAELPDDTCPRLSPDGQWVAFVSWRTGVPQVWIAARDGRRVFRCEPPASPAESRRMGLALLRGAPGWSPDGRSLAFIQGGRLCLVDLASRRGRSLTVSSPVLSFAWSPMPRHLAVSREDGGLLLLDLAEGAAVPVHGLLPKMIPSGEVVWSPTGKRLLFRAFSGVSAANFDRPSGTERAFGKLMDRVLFRPTRQEAPLALGKYEDRLILLELGGRRLTSVALADSPLAAAEIEGAQWTRAEDRAYLTARSGEGAPVLVRLDRKAGTLQVLEPGGSPSLLRPLGLRGAPGRDIPAFLAGDRVIGLEPGQQERFTDLAKLEVATLAAGPEGGYRGVEEEAITEDEPVQRLFVEGTGESAPAEARRFAEGLFLRVPGTSKLLEALRARIARGEVVDLDVNPRAGAVAVVSPGGGAGELVAWDAGGRERALTRELSAAGAEAIPVTPATLPLRAPREGVALLASAFERERSPSPMLLGGAALIVLLGVLVARRRSARARREAGRER